MAHMNENVRTFDRRDFLKTAGAGLTAATTMMTPRELAAAQALAEKARLERLAGCTWPIRTLFKTRAQQGRGGGAGGGAGAQAGARAQGAANPPNPPTASAAADPVPAIPANRDRTT